MPLQRLEALAVFEADDEVGRDGFSYGDSSFELARLDGGSVAGTNMDISTAGRPATRPGDNAVCVRVMGTPRSGTNLAKYLVERYLAIPVVFDQGFWKHGIFPALMSGRDLQYGELPIIVVSKDPVTQILS